MYRQIRRPDAESQTDVSDSQLFWLTELKSLGGRPPRVGTWLVRSPSNPANPHWRGVETTAVRGENPSLKIFKAVAKLIGMAPHYFDLAAVLQPDDHPDIERTTYVYIGAGRVPGDYERQPLPRPIVGLHLGVFAVGELPLEDMRPEHRDLLPGLLAQKAEHGFSPNVIEFAPHLLSSEPPDLGKAIARPI